MGLYVQESWREVRKLPDTEDEVGREEYYSLGDSGIYESYLETTGEAYKSFQKSYGRCIGYVLVDTDSKPKKIGWVFRQLWPYDGDKSKKFLRETWVTLHEAPDTITRTPHYHTI